MLCEISGAPSQKVESVENVKVFFEILGVRGLKEDAPPYVLCFAQSLDHRMESRERDVEKGSLVIKATFKYQRVEVRIHGAVRRCDARSEAFL